MVGNYSQAGVEVTKRLGEGSFLDSDQSVLGASPEICFLKAPWKFNDWLAFWTWGQRRQRNEPGLGLQVSQTLGNLLGAQEAGPEA